MAVQEVAFFWGEVKGLNSNPLSTGLGSSTTTSSSSTVSGRDAEVEPSITEVLSVTCSITLSLGDRSVFLKGFLKPFMTAADLSSDLISVRFWKPNLLQDQENDFERDFIPVDAVVILSPEEHSDLTIHGFSMLDCDVSYPDSHSFVEELVDGFLHPYQVCQAQMLHSLS